MAEEFYEKEKCIIPGFMYNYENNIAHLETLRAGRNLGSVYDNFTAVYEKLFGSVGCALDGDSGSEEKITVKSITDIYNTFIGFAALIEDEKKSGVPGSIRYETGGIKTDIQRDFESEILVIGDTGADFAKAYAEYVEKNAGALVVGGKLRLRNAIKRLQAVSLYRAGCSEKYFSMLDDALAIEKLGADKEIYRDAAAKLGASAEDYIASQKIIPDGDIGRARLYIAKELRDICRNIHRNLVIDIDCDAKKALNIKSAAEKLSERLMQSVNDLKTAWDENNGVLLMDSISRIVYFDALETKNGEYSEVQLLEFISNARIRSAVKQINKLTRVVAAKFDFVGFRNAAEDGSLKKYVVENFNRLAGSSAAGLQH